MRYLIIFMLFASMSVAQQTRILFLGNSYTNYNNLPQLVADIGLSKGDSIIVDSNTPGGFTFQGHSTNATSLAKINAGNYDYVVLQEQSQLPSFSPGQVANDVFPYAYLLDSLIHTANSCAKTVFYMTWGRKYGDASNCANYAPVCTYEGMQMRLRDSYVQMAVDNKAIVAPAGMAWRSSWYSDSTINLWSSDNSHPSLEGSYLTACTMYATIFRNSPIGATVPSGLNAGTGSFLQGRANQIVFDSLLTWNIGVNDLNADFNFLANQNSIQFNNTSANAITYNWNFGDGSTSTNQDPLHVYNTSGNYVVTLIASDGCTNDTTQIVVPVTIAGLSEGVLEELKIISMNNGAIRVENLKLESSFSIFSQTGSLIKEGKVDVSSNQINISNLNTGIYFINVETNNSEKYSSKFIVK
jgi:PKD repeat protein